MAAFLAIAPIIGAAAVFGFSKWCELKASVTGSVGLHLLAASTQDGNATISNTGERDIFVSSVVFRSNFERDFLLLNGVIHGGTIETFPGKNLAPLPPWRCIRNDDAKLVKDGKAVIQNEGFLFYTLEHPGLIVHDPLADHAFVDGTVTITYRPFGETKNVTETFDCKCLIVQFANPSGDFPTLALSEMPPEGFKNVPHFAPSMEQPSPQTLNKPQLPPTGSNEGWKPDK